MTSWINDVPIRVKAFAASAVLLICLAGLGVYALLILDKWVGGLTRLSRADLLEQHELLKLNNQLSAIELDVFRYAAWSSNSVSDTRLQELRSDIATEMSLISGKLRDLAGQARPAEGFDWKALLAKWQKYAKAVADTIEVAHLDPPMGTMMLGGTDDDFQRVAQDLQSFSDLVSKRAQSATQALVVEAEASKALVAGVGLFGVMLSLITTFLVARSIVRPIQAITSAMAQVARGRMIARLEDRDRRDEIGQMVRAIVMFRDRIDEDNAVLNRRDAELRVQNTRFDTAISNMTHGLAMFDVDRKLIVCNPRYAEIYRLPPELVRAGTTQEEILRHRVALGVYAGSSPEQYIKDRIANGQSAKATVRQLDLSDGRYLIVSHQPMAGGGWVSIHEDATERRRAEAKIEHMARHDSLTDLPNRVLFKEKLEEALTRVQRGEQIAVLCLDLDHFKNVNDTLGHPIGDLLLERVSERLRLCVRETDTIARLSGDEFAVIQVAIEHAENAAVLARRIIEAISQPFDLDGHHVVVGTSVGIALSPIDGADADRLLKCADTALYRAKSEGRGAYRFFETEMDARLQARRALEMRLRSALASRQLELHYQPLVNVQSGRVTGFEALLRWHHPERGLVAPAEFVPLAEEIGLIVPIGEWVLRQACAEAATWPASCKVAVNVSPNQFRSPNLVPTVVSALAASGLAAHRLEIEITESVLLENSEATFAMLDQLHALGVRISMDDFGTGYSSLSYLQRFPFNKIKIDRSFVESLGNKQDSLAIIRAVAGLGRSLGITTTAEGVETQQQLESIKAEGCDEVQGYYFSAPKPAQEIHAFITAYRERIAA